MRGAVCETDAQLSLRAAEHPRPTEGVHNKTLKLEIHLVHVYLYICFL